MTTQTRNDFASDLITAIERSIPDEVASKAEFVAGCQTMLDQTLAAERSVGYANGFRDALTQTGAVEPATVKRILKTMGIPWEAAR